MYVNLVTGETIQDDAVVNETTTGIMYYDSDCWKFLSSSEYKKIEDTDPNEYESKISYTTINVDELIDPDTSTEKTYRYFTDYFGLNAFSAGNKSPEETSGVLTDSLSIATSVPLKLKADIYQPNYTSIEFSIIDGTKEIPIVPVDVKSVQHEKLFFGLDNRMTGTNLVYYKNFQVIDANASKSDIFKENVLYTVSYTPDDTYHSYTPTHDTIRIKIIFRIYKNDAILPEVTNLRILQEVN